MTLLQHYQLSLLLTGSVAVGVGLFVLVWKRQSKVAQWLCLYLLLVGFWCWCQMQAGISGQSDSALAWGRVMFAVVIAFPVLLTHFYSAFLGIDQRRVCLTGWILVVGFWPFIFTNHFLQASAALDFLPAFPKAGPLFLPFNLVWLGWIGYDFFWLLARGPRQGTYPTREQVNLLLLAFISGYLSGCVNYFYFYGICLKPLQPFATYWCAVAILMIGYGIFAYQLFDIQVVIRRSVAYSVLVTLLTVGYFGLVYGVELLFRTRFGYHSVWLSLSAFALMAVCFQPLKIGIQRVVDWLFFRAPHEELVKRMERFEQEVCKGDQMKAVATLAAGLAHEIKNPLAAIKTFTEYLPEKHTDLEFIQKFRRIVGQEIDKIHATVQNLLAFAKPEGLKREPVALGEVVQETLTLLNGDCLKRKVNTEVAVNPQLKISGDRTKLKQVLLNLCLNSLDAMEHGGQLRVTACAENSHAILSVADTGCGIPKEHLNRLFDPFFTTKSGGTGLGLSVVQGIVKDHGGKVRIDSRTGYGTTVNIEFPLS